MLIQNRRTSQRENNVIQLFKDALGLQCQQCGFDLSDPAQQYLTPPLTKLTLVIDPRFCDQITIPPKESKFPYIAKQFFAGAIPSENLHLFCTPCARRYGNDPTTWRHK